MKKLNNKGFGIAGVLIVIVVVGLIGAVGWLVYDKQKAKNENQQTSTQTNEQKSEAPIEESTKANPYEGMTQYSNTKYGISFYHPSDWNTEEIPIDTPSGLTPSEFAINVKGNTTEKYAETASIEIHTNNLQDTAKTYEDIYGQSTTAKVNKVSDTLKGKEAVHFTVTQPEGDKTEHYLFAVGGKTYSFRSINESLNVQRSQDYWTNFQKLYDSLELK